MAKENLLQNRAEERPAIYAYELNGVESHRGLLKVGYTVRDPHLRVAEQLRTAGLSCRIVMIRSAMRQDGSSFDDHAVHRVLRRNGIPNPEGEWFRCGVETVEKAVEAVIRGDETILERDRDRIHQVSPYSRIRRQF